MPIVPLKNIGAAGVVTDADPFDLPVNSFSFAKNVRFNNGRIERGSVFRDMGHFSGNDPKLLLSYTMTSGGVQTLMVSDGGSVWKWTPDNAMVIKNEPSWVHASSPVQVTACVLNNVLYINRPDRVPWYRSKDSDGNFARIPVNDANTTQWQSGWRCRVLRSLKGVLIAANLTKGSVQYPNTVKWSNFSTDINALPTDWDFASTTSNAGENPLTEMEGPIIDIFPLRNRMYVYGERETHVMEFIGGNDMFRFDKQFDKGTIGVNCTVEVGGVHYVFGSDDLWMHDGTGEKSIANDKVRGFVFNGLIKNRSDSFFTTYNPKTNEVYFCYASNDKYVKWRPQGTDGCNRAAVYNISNGTWSFADLPYVTAAALTIPSSGTGFDASAPVTYLSVGGSFASLEAERKLNLTLAARVNPGFWTSLLLTYEPYNASVSSYPLHPLANAGAYLERDGIDMDEIKANLRGYKLVSSIYPQGRLDPDAQPLTFTFGISDHPSQATSWGAPQTFDQVNYKLDFNQAGRFLSFKAEQSDFQWFSLSGMDIDLVLLGDF